VGQGIPLIRQNWANAEAAYRLFSSDRVIEADILDGRLQATQRSSRSR
jgi:hypothetical protein